MGRLEAVIEPRYHRINVQHLPSLLLFSFLSVLEQHMEHFKVHSRNIAEYVIVLGFLPTDSKTK